MKISESSGMESFDVQRVFCLGRNIDCVPTPGDFKLGFASSTEGKLPINGLRHPVVGDTSGWYIWCGEQFSESPNFFVPIHVRHLTEKHPELIRLLGLPPGSRFLIAGDYLDIWQDLSLLNIKKG
jgi:hypothetical protein